MQLFSALLPTVGLLAQVSSAAYTLRDDYGTTDSFFDKFNFYTVCLSALVPTFCLIINSSYI